MYNTYVSSTVYSIRSKRPLSHCFNERPIFLNERCNGNPLNLSSSSCCSCWVCYEFPIHRVALGPSISYGPRQSTLLQWSISRRLMLGGRNRFCNTLPEYGRVQGCYEVPYSISDGRTCHCSEGRRYRRCCMISESDCEFDGSDGYDEEDIAEAMMSLIGEGFSCQEKIKSSRRVEAGSRGRSQAKERGLSSSRRVELERRGRRGVEDKKLSSLEKIRVERKRESNSWCDGEERKTNKYGSLDGKQSNRVGSTAVELRKDEYRQNGDQLNHSRGDSLSLRKEGSTCSSYYSLSSSGDIENDAEVEDKNVQFVEESSSGYRYDTVSDVGQRLDGQIKEEFKGQGDNEKEREEESVLGDITIGNRADWRSRKNSENNLSEVSTRVTSSLNESSEMNSRLSKTRESGYESNLSSKKKFVNKEEESKMAVTLNEQSKQCDVSGKKVGGVFINEGKKLAEVSQINSSNADAISRSQKRLTIGNENLELDANLIQKASNDNHETVGHVHKEKISRRSSSCQQLLGVSENRKIERERISHQTSQSDAVINAGESTDVLVTSNQEIEERHHQTRNHSRQNFLHLGVISVTKVGNTDTSVSSSEIRTQNEEQNAASVNANRVAKDIKSSTDQKAYQQVMSQKGSRDASNISVAHATDKLSARYSKQTFENRTFEQETNKSLVEKTVEETKIRKGQNNDRVVHTELGKEAKNQVKKSKVQGSINLVSQSSHQRIGVNEEENKTSQAVLMAPPSQLVARDPLAVDSTSEMTSQVVSRRTSGSSSGAPYMQSGGSPALHSKSYRESGADKSTAEPMYLITPDDTLGSADRLERSSAQFVGEFIEKSRINELLISETQKEEDISEVDLLQEENYGQKISVDYQMKEKDHDSRLSSRSSGTKGPSDEMWHVMDSTTEQPPQTDDPEVSAHSENAIVKRSGRSLWNVISDIVRLRWSSRAETSDSTLRSGGRNSPNESGSNETWFSGREHEETDNTKMGRTTVSEFTSSSVQLEEPNPSARSLYLSGDRKSKNIYYEVDTPSSPNIMESKPSGGNLLVSGEEISTGGGKVDVISSCLDIKQSSLPLPPQGMRRSPITEEISRSGKDDALASSSAEQLGCSSDATLPEISTTGTKDGEVKQRKLQRNKQVLRDQFDEWEEAYIIESEQRKIDEMFMREALAEAKKAADTWEVPVGAVLVKHGKIIARGCNLVEELRDSTAHAEMICIREASKLLKTWRLAETTLYVTLEPCPMCAGAILQARVENLVWGAPNKLLGADGSWVRLFPDGGGGDRLRTVGEACCTCPSVPPKDDDPTRCIGIRMCRCNATILPAKEKEEAKRKKTLHLYPLHIIHQNFLPRCIIFSTYCSVCNGNEMIESMRCFVPNNKQVE